ncbi:putative WEB family protein At4g17210 [Magnolia sinica]|uniref:putative WEB family protein At4g17210 n=1 Tax=Magnolia sinica TaxID=86752 RepID=UPI00265A782C|nr:putative WEB family protein At4g17210 [Magnolia sinica]
MTSNSDIGNMNKSAGKKISPIRTGKDTQNRSITASSPKASTPTNPHGQTLSEAGAAVAAAAVGAVIEADSVSSAVVAADGDTRVYDVLSYCIQNKYLGTVSKVVLRVPLVLGMLGGSYVAAVDDVTTDESYRRAPSSSVIDGTISDIDVVFISPVSETCKFSYPKPPEMGEIDTKPIESVQAALYLFGQKSDPGRYRSTGSEETNKEKELEFVLKDLASYKVQLEIKESAHKQALMELEIHHEAAEKLSSQLKKAEADRDKFIKVFEEARIRIVELESENKDILTQILESGEAREELLCTENEWKATHEELKAELSAAEESKLLVLRQAELMETAVQLGNEKTEELLKHVSELNEAIRMSNLAAIKAEKEKSAILLAKEEEIRMAVAAATQAQEQLDEMSKEFNEVKDSKNQLHEKSLLVDSLQSELVQARESFEFMEMELKRTREELQIARDERDGLHCQLELSTDEMQKAKNEMDEIQEREKELKIEIAMLRSELHRGRAKIAAAEAAEARANSVKSGLYHAVQELAVEAEESKKETRRLKQEAQRAEADVETPAIEESATEAAITNADSSGFCSGIVISLEEYESLVLKAEKTHQVVDSPPQDALQLLESQNMSELESFKKQLDDARAEIKDLQSVVEHSVKRAELAECAKAAIEDQLRKWREHKQRRRAALTALREESSRDSRPPICDNKSLSYQPLGKVLNMEL